MKDTPLAMTVGPTDPPRLESRGTGVEKRLMRLTGSLWFWALFLGAIFSYPLVRAVTRASPTAPPVLFALPELSFTDQTGKPFGSPDLRGKVWIANFIFTSCPTRCPQLTDAMAQVQRRLRNMGDAVFLVSFTVDPERDTPERLAEYGRKHQVNPRRWRFLTGDLSRVEEAVVKGFKLPMEPGAPDGPGTVFDITHGTRFVLVDQESRVRGFYETDEESLNQLIADLTVLVNIPDAKPAPH